MAKDWKLVFRNRLLLVVLIVYPFLIMGVIGAAFYDLGRPVPLGLVNLDRTGIGDIAWVGKKTESSLAVKRRFRFLAEWEHVCEELDQARGGLEAGDVDAFLILDLEEGGREYIGARLPENGIQEVLMLLEEYPGEINHYATAQEAVASLDEGVSNVLLAVREKDYPYLAETVWLQGENSDAASLLQRYAQEVTDIRTYDSVTQARQDLKEGRVDAVIVIPRGFVHRLKVLEEVADIQVILDQSSLVKAEFAETSIRGFMSRINEGVVKGKMEAVITGLYALVGGGDFFGTEITGLEQIRDNLERIKEVVKADPTLQATLDEGIELADTVINDIEEAAAYLRATALPIDLRISSVAGRPLSAKDAVVPSLIALSILWTGVLCGAILMVLEDEENMRTRLELTDMGPFAMVASKLSLATMVVFAQSAAMLLMAVIIFRVFASNFLLSLLVIATASFSCIGIGLVIAAFARQVAGAVILSVLVSFPLIFMTGAVFPLSQMPAFMQWIARAIPLTYALDALSGVMLRGETLADVGWQVGALLAFGAILLILGSVLVRRRTA
jgi:ABC-type multidrug transport system permease subunit